MTHQPGVYVPLRALFLVFIGCILVICIINPIVDYQLYYMTLEHSQT